MRMATMRKESAKEPIEMLCVVTRYNPETSHLQVLLACGEEEGTKVCTEKEADHVLRGLDFAKGAGGATLAFDGRSEDDGSRVLVRHQHVGNLGSREGEGKPYGRALTWETVSAPGEVGLSGLCLSLSRRDQNMIRDVRRFVITHQDKFEMPSNYGSAGGGAVCRGFLFVAPFLLLIFIVFCALTWRLSSGPRIFHNRPRV